MDPLLHVPLQLMIFQVKTLTSVPEHDGIYCHHSHPVRNVEIMGVVQMVHRASKRILYNLDDGTGAIQCIMWIPDQYLAMQITSGIPGHQEHKLGEVIRLIGQPTEFKGCIQITFQPGDTATCEDPNEETVFRLRVLNQERFVYSKPVVLPDIEKKSRPPVSTITLLDRIRAWVSSRDEFDYLELEDDKVNNELAREIVRGAAPGIHPALETAQAAKLISKCVQQLMSERIVEFKSMSQMILRVVKAPSLSTTIPMLLDSARDEWTPNLIVLDDSEEETIES
ncbi:CST complex subunit STN1 [Gamsiella multidivaricata]|nr:CST complex subunit STN1 [Gamsiella multidivaricata]